MTVNFRIPEIETERLRMRLPRMDELQKDVAALVEQDAADKVDPATTFFRIKELALGRRPTLAVISLPVDRVRAPRMTESWFC